MKLVQSGKQTKAASQGHRTGPATKNVQSSARVRSSGGAQIAEAKTRNSSVLKGRPSRGM